MQSNDRHIDVSVVVPTRNESGNIRALHDRLVAALPVAGWELVFVDDSDDSTPAVIAALADEDPRVRLVHRVGEQRTNGLGGAVMAGIAATTTEIVVVMDGDLQHPPEAVPDLLAAFADSDADLVVGSRRAESGSASGLSNGFRRLASRSCELMAYAAVPRSRSTSDPLSGFFAFRRHVVQNCVLEPDGYKILLEVLAQGRWTSCVDVGFGFAARNDGQSKADVAEARRYLRHLRSLRSRRLPVAPDLAETVISGSDAPVRPLKIMIFTSEVAPVVSGISRCMTNLDITLSARGHDVDLVSRADFPRYVHRELRLSAFVLHWPRFRRTLREYDIVNVHGPVPTMSEVFLLLARTIRRTHRPTIVYTHHSDLAIPGLRHLCWIYNLLTRYVVRSADVVLVSSDDYAAKFRDLARPVEVIPWGVDTEGKVLPRSEPRHEALRVLFVGQLRPYKGLNILLDAVNDMSDVAVTVIGDGPERARLEQLAAESLLQNVQFRGRVSENELWEAYSEHDVVVLPSLTSAEAYGLVLAEGMAAGCTPIASDLPGVREVVGESGLLVRPGNVESLHQALDALANDRHRLGQLAAESRRRAEALTIHANGARHEEVFMRAVVARRQAIAAA